MVVKIFDFFFKVISIFLVWFCGEYMQPAGRVVPAAGDDMGVESKESVSVSPALYSAVMIGGVIGRLICRCSVKYPQIPFQKFICPKMIQRL